MKRKDLCIGCRNHLFGSRMYAHAAEDNRLASCWGQALGFCAPYVNQEARMRRDRIGYTLGYCLSVLDAGAGEASTMKAFSDIAFNKTRF